MMGMHASMQQAAAFMPSPYGMLPMGGMMPGMGVGHYPGMHQLAQPMSGAPIPMPMQGMPGGGVPMMMGPGGFPMPFPPPHMMGNAHPMMGMQQMPVYPHQQHQSGMQAHGRPGYQHHQPQHHSHQGHRGPPARVTSSSSAGSYQPRPASQSTAAPPASSSTVPSPAASSLPALPALPKLASEGRYSCVPCDRGFDRPEHLAAHKAQHVKCGIQGCAFEGTGRVLTDHQSREHFKSRGNGAGASAADDGDIDGDGVGSVRRGPNGEVLLPPSLLELIPPKYRNANRLSDNPAEIEKWKAERRRNFPSDANLAARRLRDEERMQRGEVVKGAGAAAGAKRPRPADQADGAAVEDNAVDDDDDDAPPDELPSSRGAVQGSTGGGHDNDNDEEGGGDAGIDHGGTGSGSSGTSGGFVDRRPLCRNFQHGRCSNGDRCSFSHNATAPGSIQQACRWYLIGNCRAGSRCPYQHGAAGQQASGKGGLAMAGFAASTGAPKSLVGKLLLKEQEKETSMLLQCVRYIVKHDFFIDPATTTAAATTATRLADAASSASDVTGTAAVEREHADVSISIPASSTADTN